MKKITPILVSILLLLNIIVIPVYSEADDMNVKEITTNELRTIDNFFEPTYVDEHPCHIGNSHAMCYAVTVYSERCGCGLYYLECCCGRIMAIIKDYCEKHQ